MSAIGLPLHTMAHEAHTGATDELVVYGRAEEQVGVARSASEGLVSDDDLQLAPHFRVGELVEVVPGMVATQHSGTGKANQYFLRGFNLDHGTDFSAHAEGVPLNMRTHGHGQGYLDLNFLIPELVATARYEKGPYTVGRGDFSSAGSVEFTFHERLDEARIGTTIGENGFHRALAAGSFDPAGGILTVALDTTGYDGPWALDEDLTQHKLFASYAFDVLGGRAKIGLQGYEGDWKATDQIPSRAVESGLVHELGFIDPDLGGQTERYLLSGSLDFGSWNVSAYAMDYDFTLYSNFTYFLEDPLEGDEFEQRDRRRVYGAAVFGALDYEARRMPVTVRWGGDVRVDDVVEVGLYRTRSRIRTDIVRQDAVEESSLAAYGELGIALTDHVRATAGLRADYYRWDVDAYRPVNGGRGVDAMLNPKLGLAWLVADGLEGYVNWGSGFHSNDVRGATIRVDPVTGAQAERVEALVGSDGAEIGVRLEHGRRFNMALAAFRLELDSELVFIGDAGTTEPNGATERTGVEWSGFWQATEWLSVDAAWTAVNAKFRDDQGGGRAIPGAVDSTLTLGLNAAWPNGFTASARMRYLGDAPLTEDESVRAGDSLLVNAGIAYRREHLELRLDAFNLFDANDDDIAYFYASRLTGEPAAGIEDRHFHPLEPRTLRATITMYWQ